MFIDGMCECKVYPPHQNSTFNIEWDIIAKRKKKSNGICSWLTLSEVLLSSYIWIYFLPYFKGYSRMEKSYHWTILWIMVQTMLTC